jgi:hypothetical protein
MKRVVALRILIRKYASRRSWAMFCATELLIKAESVDIRLGCLPKGGQAAHSFVQGASVLGMAKSKAAELASALFEEGLLSTLYRRVDRDNQSLIRLSISRRRDKLAI